MPAPDPSKPQILCAGIVVLDEVFRVPQVPPTDTKADATELISVSGGCAANAAVAIARLGGTVSFAGPFGDDSTADRILAILAREHVETGGCVRVSNARSSVSAIIVDDDGRRTIVTYSDQNLLAATPRDPAGLVANVDCLLVDNRRPNFVMPICQAAKARRIPIVLDVDKPTGIGAPLLAIATHAIFSAESLKETFRDRDLAAALAQAYSALNKFVAVTDGSHDALWCDRGKVETSTAFKVKAVDTLAAGDVFHGAFALALANGKDLPASMRFAAAAAALKVERFGGSSTAPTREELDAFLKRHR